MDVQQVNPLELFPRAVDEFDSRVQQVKDDQWQDATPCSEWDVHALVNHLVNEDRWVPPLLGGKTIADVGDSLDGDLLGDEPKKAWDEAKTEALDSVEAVSDPEGLVNVSWGQIPAAEYVSQVLMDHVIHAWDLARAIGADENLDPELVDFCYQAAKPMEEMLRSSGAYGEHVEVDENADTQTKLLALAGRKA